MKFRRKQSEAEVVADGVEDERDPDQVTAESSSSVDTGRADGPWDASEVDSEKEDPAQVDLGGLLVTGGPGLELRLQVDESSQSVAAALLVGPEGAVELRPFAAPRHGDIWDGVRKQIAAETARRGGTATEVAGSYGTELQVAMPVTTPDGESATQPSRVLGIRGPRWLLRATFLGKPAVQPDPDGAIETALRQVVVVRGNDPIPPGEALPLVMPANAKPLEPDQPEAPSP